MSDAAARLRVEILNNPDFWRSLVPVSFVHPRTLDPNYIIPNRGHILSTCVIFDCVVASLVVGLRLYSRVFVVRRSFKLDDWLIIPAFIFYIIGAVSTQHGVKEALGRHIYDCTPEEILAWFRIQYYMCVTSLTTIFISRLSILCFLWSLTGKVEKRSRIVIVCVQVMNFSVWLITMLPPMVQCWPEFRTWDLPIMIVSKCIKPHTIDTNQKIALAMGVSGVLVDFATLAIPIRIVWKLKLPVRQRIIVSGLFAVGGFACITSTCKAFYIHGLLNSNMKFDFSWITLNPYICTEYEQFLVLVTACGPGLKPPFSRATSYISDNFSGVSKLGLDSDPAPQPYPRSREAGAAVTIGGGGKRGKKSRGLSELDSTTSIVDDGVHNNNGDFLMGDLESGQGEEGVPSVWQGEVEGLDNARPVYVGVQEAK